MATKGDAGNQSDMKKAISIVISLFVYLTHMTGLCFATWENSSKVLKFESSKVLASDFTCDAADNMLTASNATAQLTFAYDAMNRVTNATTRINNINYPSQWKRDLGGLVTNLTYATGKSVTYTHDADGLLTSVKDWLGNTWTFTRDAAGRIINGAQASQPVSSYTYDNAGRLSSWSVAGIAGRTITYDAANRRIRDEITAGSIPKPTLQRTALNTFDKADRLISSSVRYGQGTNSTPHITETFLYDNNGALTNWTGGRTSSSASFTYNALGQLSSLATNSYAYDALGNRVVCGGKLWIPNHADPLKRPLMEYAPDGTPLRYYIWGENRLLGFIDANGVLTVAHCDDFGSVIALTDVNGTVLYSANYGPHGEDWGNTGVNPTPFTWLGGYGVMAIETDTPLKLYLTRHRLYSATLNRFLSADPLGLAGGLNLYQYGEGNPMSYIDPLGLLSWRQVGYFVGGVVVSVAVTAAVVVAAPLAVAGLTAVGLSATAASATVTTALGVGAIVGTGVTAVNTYNAIQDKDWDTVAFNAGTVAGGFAAGGAMSRGMVNNMQGYPSAAPRFNVTHPIASGREVLAYEALMGYNPNYSGGSFVNWMGSAPTPAAGVFSLGGISTGLGVGSNAIYQNGKIK